MNAKEADIKLPITLKDLYPELDESQLQEAEDTLEQYVEVVLRIYNRLRLEKKESETSPLTPSEKESTMIAETSEAR